MSAKKKNDLSDEEKTLSEWTIDLPVWEDLPVWDIEKIKDWGIDIPKEWGNDPSENWSELNAEWTISGIDGSSDLDSDLDVPEPNPNLTTKDVANWMLKQVNEHNQLYQSIAAFHIQRYFGERFVYKNTNGNLAIDLEVLKEFLRLSIKTIVWNRRERFWRLRESNDTPGRSVSY